MTAALALRRESDTFRCNQLSKRPVGGEARNGLRSGGKIISVLLIDYITRFEDKLESNFLSELDKIMVILVNKLNPNYDDSDLKKYFYINST